MSEYSAGIFINDLSTSKQRREKMRKNERLAIALVMILPVMFFTASCAKKVVQSEPAPTTQPEVSKAPDRSAEEAEQAGQLQEDRLRAKADASEAAGTAFVNEGERRAESVKNFLVDLGISAKRLNTTSYGEERPIAMGQNEASWAKNRRAQFVIN
jgi:hypothetical protein